jgi:hypothetical protein
MVALVTAAPMASRSPFTASIDVPISPRRVVGLESFGDHEATDKR